MKDAGLLPAHPIDPRIEAGGRALCAWENERDYDRAARGLDGDLGTTGFVPINYEDWADDFNFQAKVVLDAADKIGGRSP